MPRQLLVSFKGDREVIMNNFKAYCAKQGISMTDKIIDLINTLNCGEERDTLTVSKTLK